MARAVGLDQEPFNGLLNGLDLLLQLGAFFDGDRTGDDRPGDPAGPPQCLLGAHKHVGHILVLTQQREVQDDLQGLCVCSHHNELRDASVKGFGGLVGSFSKLLVVT